MLSYYVYNDGHVFSIIIKCLICYSFHFCCTLRYSFKFIYFFLIIHLSFINVMEYANI